MNKGKKLFGLLIVILLGMAFFGCDKDDSMDVPRNIQVQNFIWKGMNLYYYWQSTSPDLSDNRFMNQAQLNSFLEDFTDPVDLFQHLKMPQDIDRFSVIYSDYVALQNTLQGNTLSNGMDFGLNYVSPGSDQIFGWVRYVLPNSDAFDKGIQRGDLFYAVDGTSLTATNYSQLLRQPSYTISMGSLVDGILVPNGEEINLVKTQIQENPVHTERIIEVGQHRVGYLLYNGFYNQFDSHLNEVFGRFSSQNITDLVLDLRYNSGGAVLSATRLASMITGQFTGEIFGIREYNDKITLFYENRGEGDVFLDKFTSSLNNNTPINHLGLSKVYVITSSATASASELIINGLKPYVEVIQIGKQTTGKNVGSITLYDSPDYTYENRSQRHRYAMQPIVLKMLNVNRFGDYQDGLQPNIEVGEQLSNLGELGNSEEPLLSVALGAISGNQLRIHIHEKESHVEFRNIRSLHPMSSEMYIEKAPYSMELP